MTHFDGQGDAQLGDADPFAVWDAAYLLGSLPMTSAGKHENGPRRVSADGQLAVGVLSTGTLRPIVRFTTEILTKRLQEVVNQSVAPQVETSPCAR